MNKESPNFMINSIKVICSLLFFPTDQSNVFFLLSWVPHMLYVFAQILSHEQDITQGRFFSGVQLVLNSEFSFY